MYRRNYARHANYIFPLRQDSAYPLSVSHDTDVASRALVTVLLSSVELYTRVRIERALCGVVEAYPFGCFARLLVLLSYQESSVMLSCFGRCKSSGQSASLFFSEMCLGISPHPQSLVSPPHLTHQGALMHQQSCSGCPR